MLDPGWLVAVLVAGLLIIGTDKLLGRRTSERETEARLARRKAGRW